MIDQQYKLLVRNINYCGCFCILFFLFFCWLVCTKNLYLLYTVVVSGSIRSDVESRNCWLSRRTFPFLYTFINLKAKGLSFAIVVLLSIYFDPWSISVITILLSVPFAPRCAQLGNSSRWWMNELFFFPFFLFRWMYGCISEIWGWLFTWIWINELYFSDIPSDIPSFSIFFLFVLI